MITIQEIKTFLSKSSLQNYKLTVVKYIKDKQWTKIQKEWAVNKHRPRKE